MLYVLDQGAWPIAPVEGLMPPMSGGDGVLFLAVSDEGAELVGSARVAGAPAPLTAGQLNELRIYTQAQDPSADVPASTLGVKLTELDVWPKATDASRILSRAGVSASEAGRRGVVATGADVYAAALGRPIAIPEPTGIAGAGVQPAASGGLLDFVRRHWSTLEFDRPLAMVGAEEGEALASLPPELRKALVCRDQDSGDLVVLTVAESGAGVDVVGQTLRHIGWLQEHEPDAAQRATGLIVAEEPTEDLVYAASATPNVELAALRLQLSPLSEAPVSAGGAEQRFWRTIERLSAWCAVHSLEATLAAAGEQSDPVAEGSPVWDFVATLARSVDHRCPWTVGHSTRVARLLVTMADQLRLGGDVRQYLRMAGFLHDVGNMGVPSHLFDKRTRLSPDEFSAFRRHPELGAHIVREMNLLSPVAAGVYHHHERLDGRGYPSGLVGDDIPLMARMVGAACSFDAMTSRRPYREAIRPETALDIMRAEADQHWDADIVDAIARIVR
jgi:putative nucleotidyltransferase with HDIG domain